MVEVNNTGVSPGAPGGLARLLKQGVQLQEGSKAQLEKALTEGLVFYSETNEARIGQALENFDKGMSEALFEVMYLLHVNEPFLSEISFITQQIHPETGAEIDVPTKANLYVEGAPSGILGLEFLSSQLVTPFQKYIKKTFSKAVPTGGQGAIITLQSIGSIGTIGHKSGASDMDLQVIYDLAPPLPAPETWEDQQYYQGLMEAHGWWMDQIRLEEEMPASVYRNAEQSFELSQKALEALAEEFPLLCRFLIDHRGDYHEEISKGGVGPKLVNELLQLAERYSRLVHSREIERGDEALREKIGKIQHYLGQKFPQVELYMFPCEAEMYRTGKYQSSLEFKESSGSAYELILNYDTLMPGIQFTPGIPLHFLMPQDVNNDSPGYKRLAACISFDALEIYKKKGLSFVNLGCVPEFSEDYIVAHRGAVYWEAFKASSGNLPKATLNLLRYEMLLEDHLRPSIMQLIKQPDFMNHLVAPPPQTSKGMREQLNDENLGVPGWVLLDLERSYPVLLKDPWWVRYKALKIAFAEEQGVKDLRPGERASISTMIDLAFALHIRVSDVFPKKGEAGGVASQRHQILTLYLEQTFPEGTEKRKFLNLVFNGDVQTVNRLESDLRFHFRWALERVEKKIEGFDLMGMRRGNKEVQLWLEYFNQNFEAPPNMVTRSIMADLRISRGRMRIGFDQETGWVFKSINKASKFAKYFDTSGTLEHLPEEVTLVESNSFIRCLAVSLLEGYYGILNKGTLKEVRTALEYDLGRMSLASELDNRTSTLSPDLLERIIDRIGLFFLRDPIHYTEIIRTKPKTDRVFVFLNLWKFGRLSFLYSDSVGRWFTEVFDHPTMEKEAQDFLKSPVNLIGASPIQRTLATFFWDQGVKMDDIELTAWVNPNSAETDHNDPRSLVKENYLSDLFLEITKKVQPAIKLF